MPSRVRAAAIVLGAVLLGGCGAPSASPAPASPASSSPAAAPASAPATAAPTSTPGAASSPSADPVADRDARWESAIDAVLPGLESLHPDPYHATDRATLEAALAGLRASIPTATDDELLVGLVRVFALVSAGGHDAHTGLYPWGSGTTYPLTSLPIRLWLFPDGPHVIEALPPYEDLVGRRVTHVAGVPVDEVLATLDPLVPRDNPSTVSLLLPRILVTPELLRGAGIAPADGPVELTLAGGDGAGDDVHGIEPIPMADYNAWASPYGLFLPDDPRVPSRARTGEPMWFEDVAAGVVLVAYNAVDGVPFATLDALASRLAEDDVRAVIVDVRHNTGGEREAIEPVIEVLTDAGLPTWILTGRNTFSGASLVTARLEAGDRVRIAGEPMGGSPNAFTNTRPLALGDSGLEAGVATGYEVGSDPDDRRLTIEPDLAVEITARDVARGRDPVLDAVLERLR